MSSKKRFKPTPAGKGKGSVPTPSPVPPVRSGRLAWAGFALVILLTVLWTGGHAYLVDVVTSRICARADRDIPPDRRMPVFLSEIAQDGYVWDRYAETIGQDGHWRLRHTKIDNAPDGREVHWNSAFAWYLRGLGEVYRAASGEPLRHSIFRMSIWANPILLALALAVFPAMAARRFGPMCGAVIAIGMVSVSSFYEGFSPAYPDHHGLIALSLLGMVFGIAWAGAGWIQTPEGDDWGCPRSLGQARQGMIISAVSGVAGLWISAVSAAIVLLAIGVATLAVCLVCGRSLQREGRLLRFHPELWKLWAQWGAIGCLLFYLLEYFPSEMSMRLEVNHPLYALAWWGGGWSLAILGEWLGRPAAERRPLLWRKLVLPFAACAILPGIVALGDAQVYAPKDPFLGLLHKHVLELLPLSKRIELGTMTLGIAFGWLPLFLLAALVLGAHRGVGRGTKALLLFLSIPVLMITALACYQTRWGMLTGPLYIALAGLVIPQIWRLVPPTWACRGPAAAFLLGSAGLFAVPSFDNWFSVYLQQYRMDDEISITTGQGLALLHRQIARTILDSAGDTPVVLLSSPNSSCMLAAIGGFRTIGTLYWENTAGLKAAAAGLNSQSDGEALAFMEKHGVTHVCLMNWENFIEPYFNILYPEPPPGVAFEKSFGKRALFSKVIPAWSRPLVFDPGKFSAELGQTLLILQVVPGQSQNEALFHLARYVHWVEGRADRAEAIYKAILQEAPDNNPVRLELANLYLLQKHYREAVAQCNIAARSLDPIRRRELLQQLAQKLAAAGEARMASEVATSAQTPAPKRK